MYHISVTECLTELVPHNFYQVFKTASDNMFDYDDRYPVFQATTINECHEAAYNLWLTYPDNRYTIIQPWDGSCAGGYGFSPNK